MARQGDGALYGLEQKLLSCARIDVIACQHGMIAVPAEKRNEPPEDLQPVPTVVDDKGVEDQGHFPALPVWNEGSFQFVVFDPLYRKRPIFTK
jgi:hypothetical protein